MRFNEHSELRDRHAFLSPSKSSWLRYSPQQLEARFHSWKASKRGTDLHALAHEAIRLGVKLDSSNLALANYVADALEYGMICEQPLYYSENCFGCADTICFDGQTLLIHDLKTGITPSKLEQLMVYAALFCLEYQIDPHEIIIHVAIYQGDGKLEDDANPDDIAAIMLTIVEFDNYVESLRG